MRLVFAWILGWSLVLNVTGGTLAQFRTVLGEIDVELFNAEKPATVQNFIHCVQGGVYSNIFFSRWEPDFVVQGGGFYTADRHQTNARIKSVTAFGQITNEYGVGRIFSNLYGTIAMARAPGETNSATSQWYFNLTNNSFLDRIDGGFTVFGRAVAGTNVLNRFIQPTTNNGIFLLNIGSPLTSIPVLQQHDPGPEDLIYVDITLLNVQVSHTEQGQDTISWQSVSNKLNHVQFTTTMPPVWKELISTNGTGDRLLTIDPEGGGGQRFYRVQVDY